MAQSRSASASRSGSPTIRSAASAAFLDVPSSRPIAISQSGTPTPNQSTAAQIHHITVTDPSGDTYNIDYTINKSNPGTLPASIAASPFQTSSLLASRTQLHSGSNNDALAASVAAALHLVANHRDNHSNDFDRDGDDLDSAERGEVNVIIDDANASLIRQPPSRVKKPVPGCTANFVSSVGSSVYHVATHPISSSLALVTAAPTALNALAAPSGMGPDKLGKEWWNSMSGLTRAHSIANGVSSLLINTIMNALFLPIAWQKFCDGMMHFFDSWGDVGENFGSILLAIGGAFAAAVIAYNAFLWLPAGAISALVPAGLAFLITMAQRYVGVKNVVRRVRNYFNEDARTQLELADITQHINPQYLEQIEADFKGQLNILLGSRTGDKPLTDHEREQLLIELSTILSRMKQGHPDLIKDTSTLEYITRYTGTLFDMVFAILIIAPPSFLTHMQKGFDGFNTISKLTTHHPFPLLDNAALGVFAKCAGAIPGLASALLYANSALDMRTILVDLTKHLYQNPRSIPFAITLLIANGFASGGMQNVAMGVAANPDNLAHLTPGTPISDIYIAAQTLGGGVVNSNASIKKAFLSAQAAAADVTVKDMADYATRTNERVISHATGEKLRGHSLFTARRTAEAAAKDAYQRQPLGSSFV